MITDLETFKTLVKDYYPNAVDNQNGIITIPFETFNLSIAFIPGDLYNVIFRMKVMSLSELSRPGDFAKAALAGNFFWEGTRGATLSIGPDNNIYLTERRSIDLFNDINALKNSINEYTVTLNDWRIRGQLYA